MKKIFTSFFLLFFALLCRAQITLEKNYGQSQLKIVELEGFGTHYVKTELVGIMKGNFLGSYKSFYLSITVYNDNHSILKSFQSPTITAHPNGYVSPQGTGGLDASITEYATLLSTKLFNNDSKIEYVMQYTYSDSVPIKCATANYSRQSAPYVTVFTEDGSSLYTLDTCMLGTFNRDPSNINPCPVAKVNGQYKMAIRSFKRSDGGLMPLYCPNSPGGSGNPPFSLLVYNLPGSLPLVTSNESKTITSEKAYLFPPVPNPSEFSARVQFELPSTASRGEIMLYNELGILVKSYSVDNTFSDLILNNQDIPRGLYHYQLVANGKRLGSQKMLVIR